MPSLWVSRALLRFQIAELSRAGFSSLLPDHWLATPISRKVALTFDDGSRTVWEHALPVLDEAGFHALVYLVAGAIGGRNDWDRQAFGEAEDRLMNDFEIHEWLASGHAIGAHTVSHRRLTEIPLSEAREEISASKKRLEDRFQVPVRHFCYPYGSSSPAIRDLVREAGFATATSLKTGVSQPARQRLALPRLSAAHPRHTLRNLLTLLPRGFPLRFFWQR